VTLTEPASWAAAVWITDSETFAVVPADDLSQATTPAGADCGGYTVAFTLTNSVGAAANPAYYTSSTAD
jgi:hypothetical protein